MIPKDTIDQIFETARIEEVVGDFVSLKKEALITLGIALFTMRKLHPLPYRLPKGYTSVLVVEKEGIVLILLWKLNISIILKL